MRNKFSPDDYKNGPQLCVSMGGSREARAITNLRVRILQKITISDIEIFLETISKEAANVLA